MAQGDSISSFSAGAALVRNQTHAEQCFDRRFQFGAALHLPHATGLAAPTGVHLRLHHPGIATEVLGHTRRFGNTDRRFAGRRWNTELGKKLFGLILVQVHARNVLNDFELLWSMTLF